MGEAELLDKVRDFQDKKWEWSDKMENIAKATFGITCIIFIILFYILYKIHHNKKAYLAYLIAVRTKIHMIFIKS